jgi:hypothetical protein
MKDSVLRWLRAIEIGLYLTLSQLVLALPPNIFLTRLSAEAIRGWRGEEGRVHEARSLAGTCSRVLGLWPFEAKCLQRSLVLAWLLRREGISGQLRIGVRVSEAKLVAHAWIEVQGQPVNDSADYVATFDALSQESAFAGSTSLLRAAI